MPLQNSRLIHERFHTEVRRSAVGDRGLPDGGRIDRPGDGDGSIDPDTGIWTPTAGTLIWTGDCRVQPDTLTQGRVVEVGERIVTLHRYRASIAWGAEQILIDDVFTLVRTHDPWFAGRPLMVRDVKYDTLQSRRFLDLEDHPAMATPAAEAPTDG